MVGVCFVLAGASGVAVFNSQVMPTITDFWRESDLFRSKFRNNVKQWLEGEVEKLLEIMLVAIGGAIGSVARYLVSAWAAARFGAEFPYGTLIVNIAGCFIIGAFMAFAAERLNISPCWRLGFIVGFVGGMTTFSSFSYETIHLLQEANMLRAVYNVGLNVLVGFSATWLGSGFARLF